MLPAGARVYEHRWEWNLVKVAVNVPLLLVRHTVILPVKAGSHYTANLLRPVIDGCEIFFLQYFPATCDGLALCNSCSDLRLVWMSLYTMSQHFASENGDKLSLIRHTNMGSCLPSYLLWCSLQLFDKSLSFVSFAILAISPLYVPSLFPGITVLWLWKIGCNDVCSISPCLPLVGNRCE